MTKILLAILPVLINFGNFSPDIISVDNYAELPECKVVTHCVRENWETKDIRNTFKKIVEAVSNTPRTKIVEQGDLYIHAEAKTKWLRYTDDLLVKAFPEKGIVQIRSESRVGIGDNGVNRRRINAVAYKLMTNQTKPNY